MKYSRTRVFAVTSVIVMLAGLGAPVVSGSLTSVTAHNVATKNQNNQQAADPEANRMYMRRLDATLHEHAALTPPMLKAQLLDDPDEAALMKAVDHNSVQIANTVESIYPGTRDEFLPLWRQHIRYYNDYLRASDRDDEAGQKRAKQRLAAFADQASDLLNKADRDLNEAHLEQHLVRHGNNVTTMIDNLVAKKYDTVYTLAHKEYEHMDDMSDALLRR